MLLDLQEARKAVGAVRSDDLRVQASEGRVRIGKRVLDYTEAVPAADIRTRRIANIRWPEFSLAVAQLAPIAREDRTSVLHALRVGFAMDGFTLVAGENGRAGRIDRSDGPELASALVPADILSRVARMPWERTVAVEADDAFLRVVFLAGHERVGLRPQLGVFVSTFEDFDPREAQAVLDRNELYLTTGDPGALVLEVDDEGVVAGGQMLKPISREGVGQIALPREAVRHALRSLTDDNVRVTLGLLPGPVSAAHLTGFEDRRTEFIIKEVSA